MGRRWWEEVVGRKGGEEEHTVFSPESENNWKVCA